MKRRTSGPQQQIKLLLLLLSLLLLLLLFFNLYNVFGVTECLSHTRVATVAIEIGLRVISQTKEKRAVILLAFFSPHVDL
jgi:hypothetical protein